MSLRSDDIRLARPLLADRPLARLVPADFAPILIALKAIAEAARRCAQLSTDRLSNVDVGFLSRKDECWRAFEAAIMSAGIPENAPFALDVPDPGTCTTVVLGLWDLLADQRKGRFADTAGMKLLADQASATAELLGMLTPSEPLPEAPVAPQPTAGEPPVPGLNRSDLPILQVLAINHPIPQTQTEIAGQARLSERTVRDRLTWLRKNGYTVRPSGKKGGETITEKGLRVLPPDDLVPRR
jgi:hypothetical protein